MSSTLNMFRTVLRFQILLNETFSDSVCVGSMESFDESASMVVSALFNTRGHVDSGRVF